jgi:membrane fusion protein, heavy metal efflux system
MSRTITINRGVAAIGAAGLLGIGAAGTFAWLRAGRQVAPPARVEAPPANADGAARAADGMRPAGAFPEVVVSLTPEAIERAGIVVAPVGHGSEAASIRVPGIVAPNGYRHVVVTPLVAGRVTKVLVELGQRVRRGQPLATVHGPELAEAHARLRSARARLDAHDRELQRTEKLATLGAASRQELERIHAEHTSQVAEVESARARVELLGGSSAAEAPGGSPSSPAALHVVAPLDGTVIERTANVGMNVDAATPMFTVADLSTVWVLADLFEQDAARVGVGSPAVVTRPADPGVRLTAPVTYIDPQTAGSTRTTKARIELPNGDARLRLGAYVDVVLEASPVGRPVASERASLRIPRSAVQAVGEQSVVYVPASQDRRRFAERPVRLGQPAGDSVTVLSGLAPGESIVVEGSFFIRAEAERRGLRPRAVGRTAAEPPDDNQRSQSAQVVVSEKSFEPSTLTLKKGLPARVSFTRVTENTCAKEILFPSLGIRRALPLNDAVEIRFTPTSGEIAFVCGMNMLKGVALVR